MINRNSIIITCLFLSVVFLATGTFAYFRNVSNGNINANTGELLLEINDKSSSETLEITLTNSDGTKLKPGDSGSFVVNLDATGSSLDVSIVLDIVRTNLPNNLKFYIDENHAREYISQKYDITKSNSMTKPVTIYWYWEDLEESNDNDFMFTEITATINATISYYYESPMTLYEQLTSLDYTLDTNLQFTYDNADYNGLMMKNDTQNDAYPILYYHGYNRTFNNSVVYAGKCWLIVRTTETGGIKIVYNGILNSDGSCNDYAWENVGDDSAYIQMSSFSSAKNSPVYGGYMYNDDTTYDLSTAAGRTNYKSHLADELRLDNGTGRHIQNKYDSTIKEVIDDWYEANILNTKYESMLEDTVWCNNRNVTSDTYSIDNYSSNNMFLFDSFSRLAGAVWYGESEQELPNLTCERNVDKFTVSSSNGNGDLTYPIGLLTADELWFAGGAIADSGYEIYQYLAAETLNGGFWWTLSPGRFENNSGEMIAAWVREIIPADENSNSNYGVRPSVSLNNAVQILDGEGSFEKPYIVG